jgi:carbonic anhydrase/acetyltransferase-like protein (isoleucine patch superfamily)
MSLIKGFGSFEPKIHHTAYLADDAVVIGDVEIGEDSSVWFGAVVRGDVNYIRIGDRTNIQDNSVIHVTTHTHPTILEDQITVGHRVILHGCHVESDCLIGMGAILLDGVRVGRNSMVAAGSLVAPGTQIPSGVLAIGSPARVKRDLAAEELANLEYSWQSYVELKKRYE